MENLTKKISSNKELLITVEGKIARLTEQKVLLERKIRNQENYLENMKSKTVKK